MVDLPRADTHGRTASELIAQLCVAAKHSGSSTRALAHRAGVGGSTLHRALQRGANPSSLTLAKLGLALGLRLELAPLGVTPNKERRGAPALPGHAASIPISAPGLLGLIGAELRQSRREHGTTAAELAQELGCVTETVSRAERAHAPWPSVSALTRHALHTGHGVVWVAIGAPWRERPWQQAKKTPLSSRPLGRAGRLAVHFSSTHEVWATPRDLFSELDSEFGFDLDAAAMSHNALCRAWLGPDHPDPHRRDALRFPDWADVTEPGETERGAVFLNAPYGVKLGPFTQRAALTAKNGRPVVGLLPGRTDTAWFHRWVLPYGEVRFMQGRLRFGDSANSAPFPSIIVVWR